MTGVREGRGGIATPDSQWYFDALRAGRLDLPRCADCGHFSPPPSALCSQCGSGRLEPTPSAGMGHIVSAIKDHRAAVTLAAVELDEGPWIAAALEGLPDADSAVNGLIGMRVQMHVVRCAEGEPMPTFRLA
jgi:uncharacterized OB-fold protein